MGSNARSAIQITPAMMMLMNRFDSASLTCCRPCGLVAYLMPVKTLTNASGAEAAALGGQLAGATGGTAPYAAREAGASS